MKDCESQQLFLDGEYVVAFNKVNNQVVNHSDSNLILESQDLGTWEPRAKGSGGHAA